VAASMKEVEEALACVVTGQWNPSWKWDYFSL